MKQLRAKLYEREMDADVLKPKRIKQILAGVVRFVLMSWIQVELRI